VTELRNIDWIIIEIIAIVIAVLFICLVLAPPHYLAPFLREEEPRTPPPFEINAVSHEITNLSDMYIGFEFDNSSYTVRIDITNDSIFIQAIQPEYGPSIALKVNNETIDYKMSGQGSDFPAFRYVRWEIRNLNYSENMTFSFSGKGRAIAVDNW
jgi:hypothetical protein